MGTVCWLLGQGRRVLLTRDLVCPPGLYAGVKFFLIDFIFKRCPRLRAKYDTPYIIWKSLPTDPQLKERSSTTVSRRVGCVPAGEACPPALLCLAPAPGEAGGSGLVGPWEQDCCGGKFPMTVSAVPEVRGDYPRAGRPCTGDSCFGRSPPT